LRSGREEDDVGDPVAGQVRVRDGAGEVRRSRVAVARRGVIVRPADAPAAGTTPLLRAGAAPGVELVALDSFVTPTPVQVSQAVAVQVRHPFGGHARPDVGPPARARGEE